MSGKNRKFDRNRKRNPSSAQQRVRTERNKRKRIEAAIAKNGAKAVGHVCPKVDKAPEVERVTFTHLVRDMSHLRAVHVFRKGVRVDTLHVSY